MNFSINNLFSKCEHIRMKLRIYSHLLSKSLTEDFIFCVASIIGLTNESRKFFLNLIASLSYTLRQSTLDAD